MHTAKQHQQELLTTLQRLSSLIKGQLCKLPEEQKAEFKTKLAEQRDHMALETTMLSDMRDNALRVQLGKLVALHDKLVGAETQLSRDLSRHATASNTTLKTLLDTVMVRVRTVTIQKKSGAGEFKNISNGIDRIYTQLRQKVTKIDEAAAQSLSRLLKEVKATIAENKSITTSRQYEDSDFAWSMLFGKAKEAIPAAVPTSPGAVSVAPAPSDDTDDDVEAASEQDEYDSFEIGDFLR